MLRRLVAAPALALSLAGCGTSGGEGGSGRASFWVTRDQGTRVLLTTTVPAGLTVMQALRESAEIETSYGGRFVQAINGIEGSGTKQIDWFYFVNGIEADIGAADYRLHRGDVAWWDYRSWRKRMSWPAVVGVPRALPARLERPPAAGRASLPARARRRRARPAPPAPRGWQGGAERLRARGRPGRARGEA